LSGSDAGDPAMETIRAFETVQLERTGPIAVIRLCRPDRLNAFTFQMRDDLLAAFDLTDADDGVRAVVLTGTGRAFCAGADLAAGGDTFEAEAGVGGVPPDSGGTTALRIFASRKPVIAAINGPSAGVGVTMTLPADVRIAAQDARFGFVFTRRGLVPEGCSSWFLPRVVGISTALAWTLSGAMVPAAEALEQGLVSAVVPKEDVLGTALAIAREWSAGTAPVSVALARRLLWRGAGASSPEQAHRDESLALFERGASADVREGVASFLEKRAAEFPDRVSAGLPELW